MESVKEMLGRPLRDLVEPNVQVRLPAEDIEAWNLRDDDFRALTVIGLPLVEPSEFIPDAEPGREAQEWGGYLGYHLGMLRYLDVILVVGSGRIEGVSTDGLTAAAFVNSTAEKYVECSWRYYWLQREIGGEPPTLETYEVLNAFLARAIEIDSAVGDGTRASFWPGVVESW